MIYPILSTIGMIIGFALYAVKCIQFREARQEHKEAYESLRVKDVEVFEGLQKDNHELHQINEKQYRMKGVMEQEIALLKETIDLQINVINQGIYDWQELEYNLALAMMERDFAARKVGKLRGYLSAWNEKIEWLSEVLKDAEATGEIEKSFRFRAEEAKCNEHRKYKTMCRRYERLVLRVKKYTSDYFGKIGIQGYLDAVLPIAKRKGERKNET
jgi:hypothetical protein